MNRSVKKLSGRYAQAFLNVFESQLQNTDIDALQSALDFLQERKHMFFLMELSLLPHDIKMKALHDVCTKFSLVDPFTKLCSVLVERKRATLIVPTFQEIMVRYRKRKNIILFHVTSTVALSDQQKKNVEAFLKKHGNGTAVCSYSLDKKLIAGIRIQSRSQLWDDSVAYRLQSLQELLKH